jgi:membrane protein implicated in regulation of membrane protease activity
MDDILALLGSVPFWGWFAIGTAFLIAELTSGTTYLLWPAASAGAVGILALFGLAGGWQAQWLVFGILTITLTVIGHRFVRPRMMVSTMPDLNDRGVQMIGVQGLATANFEGRFGRIKLGDTEWRAELVEGHAKKGAMLEVVSVSGATLQVKSAS